MTDLLFSLPIIFLLLASGTLLLRRKSYTESYVNGVKEGIRILYGLFPSLLLLCIFVKLVSACGIIEDISSLLSMTPLSKYVDTELLPLILTRPISGSASSAILSSLAENTDSGFRSVFAAALMISSSDTCVYIHSTYFSCVSPKKNGVLLALMLTVSIFSCITCIIISDIVF